LAIRCLAADALHLCRAASLLRRIALTGISLLAFRCNASGGSSSAVGAGAWRVAVLSCLTPLFGQVTLWLHARVCWVARFCMYSAVRWRLATAFQHPFLPGRVLPYVSPNAAWRYNGAAWPAAVVGRVRCWVGLSLFGTTGAFSNAGRLGAFLRIRARRGTAQNKYGRVFCAARTLCGTCPSTLSRHPYLFWLHYLFWRRSSPVQLLAG